jgi:phosphatidylinositol alpha-1,6-mannosyltransferase
MAIILTNNFPPSKGGIQTMLHDLAVSLHELGTPVIVVGPGGTGAAEFDRQLPFAIFRYKSMRRPFEVVSMLATFLQASKLAPKDPVIVSGWWPSGIALALLPRFLRPQYYILTYGLEIDPKAKGIAGYLMRLTYARAKAAITISQFTEKIIREAGIVVPSAVIPPGVRLTAIQPQRSITPTILSVGRLVPRKGFDMTLRAIAELTNEFPNLRYEIVGDGPQRQELELLSDSLGIRDRVVFHGKASDQDLQAAYARAWCFSLPVRRIGSDVEGFGIVYLEAAMAQLPCIGGRDSGATDAVADGQSGLLVDGTDVRQITEALRSILLDPERAMSMGQVGQRRAEADFQWPDAAKRIHAFINREFNR